MAPKPGGAKRPAEATSSRAAPGERFSGLALPNTAADRVHALEMEALGARPVVDPGVAMLGSRLSSDRRPPPPPPPGGGGNGGGAALARDFGSDSDDRALAGKVYRGRVSNVMDFGCFVQLEGVKGKAEGLVHVSLIQSQPLRTPHDVVTRGQPCFVKVGAASPPPPNARIHTVRCGAARHGPPSPPTHSPATPPRPPPLFHQVISSAGSKLSLSMRDADQSTGHDLAPNTGGGPSANPPRRSDPVGEAERKRLQAAAGSDDGPARPIKRLTSPEL
jgi:hypothetical protein